MKPDLISMCMLVSMAATSAASAGQSEWKEVLPDVRMRLVAMPYYGNGYDISAAIEIEMPKSHKTYWRIPGQSGFPAEINFSHSSGVLDAVQQWPIPAVETVGNDTDYVYRGSAFLPILVTPSEGTPQLTVSAFLGICSDICMPVSVQLSLELGKEPIESLEELGGALASIPTAWPFDVPPFGNIVVDGTMLDIEIDPQSGVDLRSVVLHSDDGETLYGRPVQTGSGIAVPVMAGPTPVKGTTVNLMFRSDQGVYSIVRTVD